MCAMDDLAILLKQFGEAAIRHQTATEDGNFTLANRSYHVMKTVCDTLQVSYGLDALLILLNHEDKSVRLWAAAHTLRIDPVKALAIIKALRSEPGHIGFNAQMLLEHNADTGSITTK